jgi:hypothetical protein
MNDPMAHESLDCALAALPNRTFCDDRNVHSLHKLCVALEHLKCGLYG